MAALCRSSRRFTPRTLNQWRVARGLYVREMADLLGYSVSRLKDKLYGRRPLTMELDRALSNIEYCIARGVPPDGWPDRLRGRIFAAPIEYNDPASAKNRGSSPEELS